MQRMKASYLQSDLRFVHGLISRGYDAEGMHGSRDQILLLQLLREQRQEYLPEAKQEL